MQTLKQRIAQNKPSFTMLTTKFNEGKKDPFVKVINHHCSQNSKIPVLKVFGINLV